MNLDELIAKLIEFKEVSKSHDKVPVFFGEEMWQITDGQYVENYPPLDMQPARFVRLRLGHISRGLL